MRKVFCSFLFVVLLSGTAAISMAHTKGINGRERSQKQRIRQGIRQGELTRREAARLTTEETRIRAFEARARSDGGLNIRERARLNHLLNQSSRHIYRQKHDRQDR